MPEDCTLFRPTAAGTARDLREGTDLIAEASFFGSEDEAAIFARIAFEPVVASLPQVVRYADFGGAHGLLASVVQRWIAGSGREVQTTVVDANETYLAAARDRGISVVRANIEEHCLRELDVTTMRLVSHYNGENRQVLLLRAVHDSLAAGGVFASQIETANASVCELQTRIANLPSLNRDLPSGYYWATVEQYTTYLEMAGFHDIQLHGFSPDVVMTTNQALSTAWKRFNGRRSQDALLQGSPDLLMELSRSRKIFFAEAGQQIEEAIDRLSDMQAHDMQADGTTSLANGEICLRYPIFVARR